MMEVIRVGPLTTVKEHNVKLSVPDTYSPKLWVTQTHFWPLEGSQSFEKAYNTLRQGLQRLVTEFPTLLGTIGRYSKDPRDLQIVVGSGATIEFSREDISLQDGIHDYQSYRAQGFPITKLVTVTSPTIILTPVSEGAPMFAAKLNALNGGMALTFGFNHVFTDASAITELERIWALHTADVSTERPQQHYKQEVNSEAICERMSMPVPGAAEFKNPHWAQIPTAQSQHHLPHQEVFTNAALTMIEEKKKAHVAATNGAAKVLRWCHWYFSPESAAQVKNDIPGSKSADMWVSTLDALIGLCWSRIAHINQKSREGKTDSLAAFAMNIRHRIQPPVEAKYIGNLVDIIVAQCSLTELEANETGVAAAARSIRKVVESWSQPNWEAWLSLACTLPPDQSIVPYPVLMLETQNMAFNDYSKSQSHVLDWGVGLGRIDRTRYHRPAASVSGCATVIVVQPRLADGGIEVAITCDDDMRVALENDAVFRRYTKLTAQYE